MKPNELSDAECDAIYQSTHHSIHCEIHVAHALIRAAYAAGAAAVPKEPTPEMITAGREAIEAWGANGPVQVWQAMHDAATGVTK